MTNIFHKMVGVWQGLILSISATLKTTFCKYWTLTKTKVSITCVSTEYENKKKIQQQWLQSKTMFPMGNYMKIVIHRGNIFWWGYYVWGFGNFRGRDYSTCHRQKGKPWYTSFLRKFFKCIELRLLENAFANQKIQSRCFYLWPQRKLAPFFITGFRQELQSKIPWVFQVFQRT